MLPRASHPLQLWHSGWPRRSASHCLPPRPAPPGTFDVSLLSIDDGIFEVKATAGDTHLVRRLAWVETSWLWCTPGVHAEP